MDKIKILNVLQGKVFVKNDHYAIGFVTKYGVATIRMHDLDKFLAQNPHLKPILKSSVIESDNIIRKFINIKNKAARYITSGNFYETRIKIF